MNNKIVFITGTPGVGKTTIANALNNDLSKKYDSKIIKINELAINNGLIIDKDLERGYKIVDIDKLSKKLNETINSFFKNPQNSSEHHNDSKAYKIVIVEGHLSHLCNIENNTNTNTNSNSNSSSIDFKVLVLRLNPHILQNRLKSRSYSENKIHENLEAEALGVCAVEAYENHWKNANEIDTTNLEVKNVVAIIKDILFNRNEFPMGNVDFMQWILEK